MKTIAATIRYLSRDRKINSLIWINAAAISLFLLTILMYFYIYIYAVTLAGNIDNYKSYIEASNRKIKYLDFFSKNKDKVEESYLKISSKYSQPELIRELQLMADKSGIDLISQNYRDDKYDGVLVRHIISVSAKGNYSSLKKYLETLEGVRGVGVVERVTMTSGDSNAISADIQMSVFSMRKGV